MQISQCPLFSQTFQEISHHIYSQVLRRIFLRCIKALDTLKIKVNNMMQGRKFPLKLESQSPSNSQHQSQQASARNRNLNVAISETLFELLVDVGVLFEVIRFFELDSFQQYSFIQPFLYLFRLRLGPINESSINKYFSFGNSATSCFSLSGLVVSKFVGFFLFSRRDCLD